MVDLQKAWNEMVISDNRKDEIIHVCKTILSNKDRYKKVETETGVPYYVVASIHYRESTLSFNHHLHNGDSLLERTTHVPAGRPRTGEPPFTWEESATDALKDIEIDNKSHVWSITNMLYQLERYNGFAYRKYGIFTPYLWAATNHYDKGKYVEDGVYDPNAIDHQLGCAPLIRYLTDKTLGLA
jgi:lysozyme family protein